MTNNDSSTLVDKIAEGRTDLIVDYLSKGYSAKVSDSSGVSLMQWCAFYGDVTAIRLLVEKGESLGALGENLDLSGASFHGYWKLCQYLIDQGADVNYRLPDTGETPLHSAICKNKRGEFIQIIKILLHHGANPNLITNVSIPTDAFMRDCRTRAETPLHRAAAFATEEEIQLLLDAGAKIDAKDMNGDSPLSWASWHLRPASILRKLCYGNFRIHPAAV